MKKHPLESQAEKRSLGFPFSIDTPICDIDHIIFVANTALPDAVLPSEERRKMMKSHGMIGRSYGGKVRQIITGSIGLDDWEWGVSLFSDDPLYFKKLVQEMRFDEVSARFGEFGPFYVGCRLTTEKLDSLLSDNVTTT